MRNRINKFIFFLILTESKFFFRFDSWIFVYNTLNSLMKMNKKREFNERNYQFPAERLEGALQMMEDFTPK